MTAERSVARRAFYVAIALSGMISIPLSLCILGGQSLDGQSRPTKFDWFLWAAILVFFVGSISQMFLQRIRRHRHRWNMPQVKEHAIRFTHKTISFLHGLGIAVSIVGGLVAGYALIQSVGDSVDSFLQAPIGTKQGHLNTGFGADWHLYLFVELFLIALTIIFRSLKKASLVPQCK